MQSRVEGGVRALATLAEQGYVVLALESGVVPLGGTWFEVTAMMMHDPRTGESMHTFSQTTAVATAVVERALAMTPPTYIHRDTGVRFGRARGGAGAGQKRRDCGVVPLRVLNRTAPRTLRMVTCRLR